MRYGLAGIEILVIILIVLCLAGLVWCAWPCHVPDSGVVTGKHYEHATTLYITQHVGDTFIMVPHYIPERHTLTIKDDKDGKEYRVPVEPFYWKDSKVGDRWPKVEN